MPPQWSTGPGLRWIIGDHRWTAIGFQPGNNAASSYQDVLDLRLTSNMAERFLTKAGFAFNELWQALLPMYLEMQLFLNFKRQFWGTKEVAKYIKENAN